jgi:hypothetical protein
MLTKSLIRSMAALVLVGTVSAGVYLVVSDVNAEQNETAISSDGSSENPFVEHVRQANLPQCTEVIPVLGDIVTTGTTYDVQTQWDQDASTSNSVQSLIGLEYQTQELVGPGAGVVYAIPTHSGCRGIAVRIVPLPESCADVPSSLQVGSTKRSELRSVAVYDLPSQTGQVALIPNGAGCVGVSIITAHSQQ